MAILTRANFLTNIAKGKGYLWTGITVAPVGPTTVAVGASGWFTIQLVFGPQSTLPGTLVSIAQPAGFPASLSAMTSGFGSATGTGFWLCWIYKLGTVDLTLTGEAFTHDAATFPVLRTQFAVASQPISLLPLLYLTTATTTTAAIFDVRNPTGPASGYVNQDGTSVTGTKTFTMPATATAINSSFFLRMEDGDSGVRDITHIDVTTPAAVGAASLYGVEPISPLYTFSTSSMPYVHDALYATFSPCSLEPAVATSGTATAYLVGLHTTSINAGALYASILGAKNT